MRFNRLVDPSHLQSFLDSFVEFMSHKAITRVVRMVAIDKQIGLDGRHVDDKDVLSGALLD